MPRRGSGAQLLKLATFGHNEVHALFAAVAVGTHLIDAVVNDCVHAHAAFVSHAGLGVETVLDRRAQPSMRGGSARSRQHLVTSAYNGLAHNRCGMYSQPLSSEVL